MIDSERICFASDVFFLLHSLSDTSFGQLCNEMWLLSTALFNCKNCCKLQIYSHDAVLTELLSELWRDSMEVSSLLLFLCFPLRRDGKSRLCPSMWKNMLSVVAYWNCKLLPGKYCQRTLNWNYKGVKI